MDITLWTSPVSTEFMLDAFLILWVNMPVVVIIHPQIKTEQVCYSCEDHGISPNHVMFCAVYMTFM